MSRLFVPAVPDYLRFGTAVLTSPPLTMFGWYRTNDVTVDQNIVSIQRGSSGNHYWALGVFGQKSGAPVVLEARDSGTGPSQAITSTGSTVNTWHTALGVVVSAIDRTVTIDGGSPGTSTTNRSPAGLTSTSIGMKRDSTPSEAFSGNLALVTIWNVALNANERAALARGVHPLNIRPLSIVAPWPIWGLHSPEIDLSGNGQEMVLNGSPARSNHAPVEPYSRSSMAATVPPIVEEAPPAGDRRILRVN